MSSFAWGLPASLLPGLGESDICKCHVTVKMTTVTYLYQGVVGSCWLLSGLILRKVDKIRCHIDTHLLVIQGQSLPVGVKVLLGAVAILLHPLLGVQPSVHLLL